MRCNKCHFENVRSNKFCGKCGVRLSEGEKKHAHGGAAASVKEDFWKPDWKWHLKVLGGIYLLLVVMFFVLDNFLANLPEPYKMRDIPQEMTPWLKK